MPSIIVSGQTVQGVTKRIASNASEFEELDDVLGAWVCRVNGQYGQLVVATTSGLVISTESQTHQVPWDDITTISSEGITTSSQSILFDFSPISNVELLSWMAFHYCPQARTVSLSPPEHHLEYAERTPEWRRSRNMRMTDALRGMGKKYSNVLGGERYNLFSLIGTNDWEDYASLTVSAMTLESISDLDERVEKIEALLTEIRDLLADQKT